jgi:carboxypeptidase C (cathepsin A)
LQGWLKTFPEYIGRPFFIFGESYAGHYVPSLGYAITIGNKDPSNIYIPLQSISIGNGLTSPIYQYASYGPFARAHAMINKKTQDQVNDQYAKCQAVLEGGPGNPTVACNSIWNIIDAAAGPFNVYDVSMTCTPDLPLCYNFTLADIYLNQDDVQEQLHVDKKWKQCSNLVHQELAKDWWVESDYLVPDILASGVYVNVYAGIEGYICNFLGQEFWMNRLNWPYLQDYLKAEREIWMVDDIIAGYRQASHGLANISVNNAGQMAPMDQPKNSLDMFTRILNNQTFA